MLLAAKEFPLSPPELAKQLKEIGDHDLVATLEQWFQIDEPTPDLIDATLKYHSYRATMLKNVPSGDAPTA